MIQRLSLLCVLVSAAAGLGGGGCSGSSAADLVSEAGAADAPTTDGTIGEGGGGGGDASKDAGTTDTGAKDSGAAVDGAGVVCGTGGTCAIGDVCCGMRTDGGGTLSCVASCPHGGFVVSCDGPEDCTSGAENYCCATFKIGAGTPPSCPAESISAACTTTCTTSLQLACPSTSTVRLCHESADCADDPAHNRCCLFSQGGQRATFCVDGLTSLAAIQCF